MSFLCRTCHNAPLTIAHYGLIVHTCRTMLSVVLQEIPRQQQIHEKEVSMSTVMERPRALATRAFRQREREGFALSGSRARAALGVASTLRAGIIDAVVGRSAYAQIDERVQKKIDSGTMGIAKPAVGSCPGGEWECTLAVGDCGSPCPSGQWCYICNTGTSDATVCIPSNGEQNICY